MSELMELLMDHFARPRPRSRTEDDSGQAAAERFQQLKELVGDREAVEIWDAATATMADEVDLCFQAGMRAGVELMVELLRL